MSYLWVKYLETRPVKINVKDCEDIDDLIELVNAKLQLETPPQNITIHLSNDTSSPSLHPGLALSDISKQPGFESNSDEHPLIVRTLSSLSGTRSFSEVSISDKQPHPKRLKRWNELNDVLLKNKRFKNDSTAYSYVSWNDVKSIFETVSYIQETREVSDTVLSILSAYLKFGAKVFGTVTTGKESKRLHFISPIIVSVCYLFNGDVTIDVEEDLNGDYVKAHGHFEFVLRRGSKRVCIVEAKKDDMEQGMAQDLIGCEVAADVGKLDIVYGIVTNYCQWNFLRSYDEKIELEECTMDLENGVPTEASLKKIAGKIYKMLSD